MKISVFLSEIFQFLELKLFIYLNRRVFVMYTMALAQGYAMARHRLALVVMRWRWRGDMRWRAIDLL